MVVIHPGAAAGGGCSPRRSSKSRSQTASPHTDSNRMLLRQLVTPSVAHRAPSFDELLHLRSEAQRCSVVSTAAVRHDTLCHALYFRVPVKTIILLLFISSIYFVNMHCNLFTLCAHALYLNCSFNM